MNIQEIKKRIDESFDNPTSSEDGGRISYSQYSKFAKCPKSWELGYGRNLRTKDPSIHTMFGTAFHETMQSYLTLYMNDDPSYRDYSFPAMLRQYMIDIYQRDIQDSENYTSAEEMHEFWQDGVEIFEEFDNTKDVYFDPRRYSLLGIEAPLFLPVEDSLNVNILAFIDIVLYDKLMNVVKIVDIKTSTSGWNKYMRGDRLKQAQLILYKMFFAKQYDIPLENLDVEFLICKRKLDYGTERISSYSFPTPGDFLEEVVNNITSFVKYCFNDDGSYNLNNVYYAVSGDRNKNCKFCEFKDREDLCPKKERLKQLPT